MNIYVRFTATHELFGNRLLHEKDPGVWLCPEFRANFSELLRICLNISEFLRFFPNSFEFNRIPYNKP